VVGNVVEAALDVRPEDAVLYGALSVYPLPTIRVSIFCPSWLSLPTEIALLPASDYVYAIVRKSFWLSVRAASFLLPPLVPRQRRGLDDVTAVLAPHSAGSSADGRPRRGQPGVRAQY
jgi:hypothetical protein